MTRLLVTGSRNWTDELVIGQQLDAARLELGNGPVVLVHGDARGVDRLAARIWSSWGLPVEAHPADWRGPCKVTCSPNHRRAKSLGMAKVCPAAGLYRNAEMVELGADLCLAFILDGSPGATKCAALARKRGIRVRTVAVRTARPAVQPPRRAPNGPGGVSRDRRTADGHSGGLS
jgi:YspA, cpYpsA-related SLOG family